MLKKLKSLDNVYNVIAIVVSYLAGGQTGVHGLMNCG